MYQVTFKNTHYVDLMTHTHRAYNDILYRKTFQCHRIQFDYIWRAVVK